MVIPGLLPHMFAAPEPYVRSQAVEESNEKRADEAERLQNLVYKLFISTLISRESKFRLSYPLIPRISEEYLRNRIVVVGQETNTWYDTGSKYGDYNDVFLNKKHEIEKESLCNRYDDFVNKHVREYGGKFWSFNRLLYEKGIIEGDIVKLKCCAKME